MSVARSGIDNILNEILKLEESIKSQYGRTAGRVRIANAKTSASYAVDKGSDFMRWHVEYLGNLKHQL